MLSWFPTLPWLEGPSVVWRAKKYKKDLKISFFGIFWDNSFTWVEIKSLVPLLGVGILSFEHGWRKLTSFAIRETKLLNRWFPSCWIMCKDQWRSRKLMLCSLVKKILWRHHAGSNDIRWKGTFNEIDFMWETNRFKQMFHDFNDTCFCLEQIYMWISESLRALFLFACGICTWKVHSMPVFSKAAKKLSPLQIVIQDGFPLKTCSETKRPALFDSKKHTWPSTLRFFSAHPSFHHNNRENRLVFCSRIPWCSRQFQECYQKSYRFPPLNPPFQPFAWPWAIPPTNWPPVKQKIPVIAWAKWKNSWNTCNEALFWEVRFLESWSLFIPLYCNNEVLRVLQEHFILIYASISIFQGVCIIIKGQIL